MKGEKIGALKTISTYCEEFIVGLGVRVKECRLTRVNVPILNIGNGLYYLGLES